MGGVYIRCGTFEGNDKSCSPIESVLDDLARDASEPELDAILRIKGLLHGDSYEAIIDIAEAELLRPLVCRYCQRIVAQIAPITDPFEQIKLDHDKDPNLDPIEAKYGKGLGWKYYCSIDLEYAFTTSGKEMEPVIITWD